jgi:hypothetical protein
MLSVSSRPVSFSSWLLVRSACSTVLNCTSWLVNWVASSGESGSWCSSWAVSSFRKPSKLLASEAPGRRLWPPMAGVDVAAEVVVVVMIPRGGYRWPLRP